MTGSWIALLSFWNCPQSFTMDLLISICVLLWHLDCLFANSDTDSVTCTSFLAGSGFVFFFFSWMAGVLSLVDFFFFLGLSSSSWLRLSSILLDFFCILLALMLGIWKLKSSCGACWPGSSLILWLASVASLTRSSSLSRNLKEKGIYIKHKLSSNDCLCI